MPCFSMTESSSDVEQSWQVSEDQSDLETIFQNVSKDNFLGEFTQQRMINDLPIALKSSGDFIFLKGHGLYWNTEKPFAQAITFKADDIIRWNGVQSDEKETKVGVVQRETSKMLLAFFSADLAYIQKRFTVELSVDGSRWKVDLEPKSQIAKKIINTIQIIGQDNLDSLTLSSGNGDVTNIQFFEIHTIDDSLDQYCQYYYRNSAPGCFD